VDIAYNLDSIRAGACVGVGETELSLRTENQLKRCGVNIRLVQQRPKFLA